MSDHRKHLPPPSTDDVLSRRFNAPAADGPAHTPATPHTSHTSQTTRTSQPDTSPPAPGRRAEPAGMVRKTYYLSEATANALAAAVDRLHYDSRGRVSKHQALAEIVSAGITQLDTIAARVLADE